MSADLARVRDEASGKILRSAIVLFVATQMTFVFALPSLYGSSSDAVRTLGVVTGRETIAGWAAFIGIGHLLSLIRPYLQRFFGLCHAAGCLYIGWRFLALGFGFSAAFYLFGYALLGLAIAITAPRRMNRRASDRSGEA